MISVIVKGNRYTAARVAAERGIPFAFQAEHRNGQETVGLVSEEYEDKVIDWFIAHITPPFPDGACLFYDTFHDTFDKGEDQ